MSHWFEYFPGNHMWSQGMMFGIEMAAWGAAALGEIDQMGQRLRGHEGDNERWWSEWTAMAERIEAFGDAEEARGHRLASGAYYSVQPFTISAASASLRRRSASGTPIAVACAASAKASSGATRRWSASRCRMKGRRCRRGC